tara:strand:+ start:5380 stop:6456 length:1077 start_codon:yes stop_codon:yes gene_type:complete
MSKKRAVLTQKIEQLMEANAHRPKQCTPEWLVEKQETIGGSSLYAAVHTTKSYLSNRTFSGNLYTEWGNIFEPVIETYSERRFFTKIYGTDIGAIPSYVPHFAYSMDGIGVVGSKIMLFEFKCPWSRLPGDSVPKHYEYQVKAGLDTFDIAQKGIYAEAVFRACSLEDLRNNINAPVHKLDMKGKHSRYDSPMGHGLICFYGTKRNKYNKHVFCGKKDITDIIYQHKDSQVQIWETPIILPENEATTKTEDRLELDMGDYDSEEDDKPTPIPKYNVYSQICDFAVFCEKNNYVNVGVMPYKLYEYNVIAVQKEKGFLLKFAEKIAEVAKLKQEIYKKADQEIEDLLATLEDCDIKEAT